jgi:hypothetical protein
MRKPNKHSADFSKHPWTQARASHQAPKFHTSRRLHLFRLAARISVDVELLWPANSRQGRCVDKSPSCPSSKAKACRPKTRIPVGALPNDGPTDGARKFAAEGESHRGPRLSQSGQTTKRVAGKAEIFESTSVACSSRIVCKLGFWTSSRKQVSCLGEH